MSIAPEGRIDLVWWDFRDGAGLYATDVYYALAARFRGPSARPRDDSDESGARTLTEPSRSASSSRVGAI